MNEVYRYKSKLEGKELETNIITHLEHILPFYNIRNVSKDTHSGDIWIYLNQETFILIDTKNYARKIPQTEISKFEHDESDVYTGTRIHTYQTVRSKTYICVLIVPLNS